MKYQNNNILKLLSIAILVLIISGCSGTSIPKDSEVFERDEMVLGTKERFEKNEVAVEKVHSVPYIIVQPKKIPKSIGNREIIIEMPSDSTMGDFVQIMAEVDLFFIPSSEVELNQRITLPKFKGTVQDLLNIISSLYDVGFNYQTGNAISLELASNYIVNVPQDSDLLEEIKGQIEALGAKNVTSSLVAGSIMYQATPKTFAQVTKYIQRFFDNAAVITFQVAIVTVNLNRDKSTGFDWSQIQSAFGSNQVGREPYAAEDSSGLQRLGQSVKDFEALGAISGQNLGFKVLKGDFSFGGVINFLSTYGKTTTEQSALMKTLSGKEVKLQSGQSVPYIKEISSSLNQNGSNSGVEIERSEVGLTLEITPFYDSKTQMITADVNLDLSSILGFIELSAGNDVGTISQPNEQKQTFNNFIKLKAGEASIIGGITFQTTSDNRNSIAYIENHDASKKTTLTRNAVFILLRPSVTIFGDFDK